MKKYIHKPNFVVVAPTVLELSDFIYTHIHFYIDSVSCEITEYQFRLPYYHKIWLLVYIIFNYEDNRSRCGQIFEYWVEYDNV